MAIPNAEKQPVRILVVDDESDLELLIRQHYRKEIKENTYLFTFARNGQEALEIIHEHPQEIDLILTDINMPEIDGLTLLSQLEHEDLILKPIIVSAYGDMANIRKAMNLGAFDFITKPINFEDMDITLKKTISIVRKLQTITELEAKHAKIQKEAIQKLMITINHELNSPLTAILIAAQKLNDPSEKQNAQRYADVIIKGAKRIDEIIQKLKTMTEPLDVEYISGIQMLELSK